MITSFRIKNFRSIKEEIEIDFEAMRSLNKKNDSSNGVFKLNNLHYLKAMALYGQNASGKSNVIKAVKSFLYLVKESDKLKHGEKIPVYEPFLFEEGWDEQPTEFGINYITLNGIKYEYSIVFNRYKIFKEALHFYPKKNKAKLFVRENKNFSFGEYFKGEKSLIEKIVLENQLVLSKAASFNFNYLNEAYSYISERIIIQSILEFELEEEIAEKLNSIKENQLFKRNFLELLKAADFSIKDFHTFPNFKNMGLSIAEPNLYAFRSKNSFESLSYDLFFAHNLYLNGVVNGVKLLQFGQESLGTQKTISHIWLFLKVLSEGKTLLIDELDNSLHPLLTKMLINLFNSDTNNPKNAQLFFTTHNESLMDSNLLQRDQIAITDRNKDGSTDLFRISDIKGVRGDRPLDKWYITGRFGGIPAIYNPELKFE